MDMRADATDALKKMHILEESARLGKLFDASMDIAQAK
jgi:hypothetical protein